MNTIFTDAIAPTPDPNGGHEGTRGGYPLEAGGKETPGNVIGQLPTLVSVKDAPMGGSQGGLDVIDQHNPGMTFKG